jgi:hypothetical protein
MQKKHIIVLIIFTLLLFSNYKSKALDTLAFISIHNTTYIDQQTLEFELRIQRNSLKWLKFANGTFQINFPDSNFKFNISNLDVSLLETVLPPAVMAGNELPTEGYLIEPKIFDNRISITVVGPPKFDLSESIPLDTTLTIGKFRIKTSDGRQIPKKLSWLTPYYWYQALAFKIAQDSVIDNVMRYYYSEDNVSMDDQLNITFNFKDDNTEPIYMLDDMWVKYIGQFVDSIMFRSKSEYQCVGYTLKRGIRSDIIDLEYTDTIFTYLQGKYFNPGLISQGSSSFGFTYGPFFDTVQYRGGDYCYSLHATLLRNDGTNYDSLLAERCITVPNAVITKADASPNPFSGSTKITYTLDDDVLLTVASYDVLGKKIRNLKDPDGKVLDKVFMKKGKHTTNFDAPDLASQGLYSIVFLAYPIKDPSVEFSRAVVKVQLIRD